jgi:hypothetical protein
MNFCQAGGHVNIFSFSACALERGTQSQIRKNRVRERERGNAFRELNAHNKEGQNKRLFTAGPKIGYFGHSKKISIKYSYE